MKRSMKHTALDAHCGEKDRMEEYITIAGNGRLIGWGWKRRKPEKGGYVGRQGEGVVR